MQKQTLAVVAGAIVLFALAIFGSLQFMSSPGEDVHIMPDGRTMTGAEHEAP
jgi:hypothetical protein